MGTYAYEVVVPEKLDGEGDVLRVFARIASESGVQHRPTREGLLVRYAAEIKDALQGRLEDIGDVQVVIGPSVGPFGSEK